MIVGVLMPEHNYKINISSDDGLGIPNIDAYFGRITVLLGANGTGKSRALKRLCDQSFNFGLRPQAVVYMEGGRVIPIPKALKYDTLTYEQFGTLQQAKK